MNIQQIRCLGEQSTDSIAKDVVDKTGASKTQNTTHTVSQKIFRGKACSGIEYTFSDKLKKTFVSVIKWTLFPITLPSSYVIRKLAVRLSMANELAKLVNKDLVRELEALGGEDIDFEAEDGIKLKGMMFNSNSQRARSGKTILICSGSHLSQENYNVPIVRSLLELGHNVMTFNYRGFGLSEGEASESGLYMDGEAAYQYILNKKISVNNLVVYGYSLGGAIASELAARHRVDVVLDRTFSSGSDQAVQVAPNGLGWLAKMIAFIGCQFDNVKKLKYMKGRIFIYQEEEADRHNIFLKRMQEAIAQARNATIKELEASGLVVTAHENVGHFHSEESLWFGAQSKSSAAQKLQLFLAREKPLIL